MWLLGVVCGVVVLGFVAYKFPSWFSKTNQTAADAVNKVDNEVKKDVGLK